MKANWKSRALKAEKELAFAEAEVLALKQRIDHQMEAELLLLKILLNGQQPLPS